MTLHFETQSSSYFMALHNFIQMFDLQNSVSDFSLQNIRIFRNANRQNNIPILCDEIVEKAGGIWEI